MTKIVFVTGGAGFIGRELARKLLLNGHKVVCFDLSEQFQRQATFFEKLQSLGDVRVEMGTILDKFALQSAMRGADAVFHMAAMLGVRRTEENRLRCLDINVTGSDNVLQACILNNINRFIFASSSEVYGEPTRNPIRETDETKGKTVYAVSKLAAEELTKGYGQVHPELKYTIVRFFNTYGEGQVAQFVMSRFVKQVLAGQRPTVYGDGSQRRSYCHVDDTTDGLLKVLTNPRAHNKTYNIGNSTQVVSLIELAQKVIDVLAPGKEIGIDVLGGFGGSDRDEGREIFARWCDTNQAQTDLGYQPRVTIEEGVRRIAASGEIHADWAHRF